MAFDFIRTLLGVKRKPATRIVETMIEPILDQMVEPIIQEKLEITEKSWRREEEEIVVEKPTPKRYSKKQLMEMTKKEIVELSQSALNVKNDGRVKKEELIEEFMLDQRNYHKKLKKSAKSPQKT